MPRDRVPVLDYDATAAMTPAELTAYDLGWSDAMELAAKLADTTRTARMDERDLIGARVALLIVRKLRRVRLSLMPGPSAHGAEARTGGG